MRIQPLVTQHALSVTQLRYGDVTGAVRGTTDMAVSLIM